MKAPTGPKPLYERITAEQLKAACDDIRTGTPKVTAFVCRGFGRVAFHRAQRAGRAAELALDRGEKLDDRQAAALAFWCDVEKAWSQQERALIQIIAKVAGGQPKRTIGQEGTLIERYQGAWQAAAWLLERQRPEYRAKPIEPEGLVVDESGALDLAGLSDSDYHIRAEELARELADELSRAPK